MGDMTVSAGRGILLFLNECFGVLPFEITLVFLGMTSFTLFIIIKKCGIPTQEFWVRVFQSFFFNV
jgi:hypothetical protein